LEGLECMIYVGLHRSRPYVDRLSTIIVTPRTYPVTDEIALAVVEIIFNDVCLA
jgi:hypothetical protein